MAAISENILPLMGLNPSGDLGPFTIFRTRRLGVVWFPRSPPNKPPSYLQRRQRNAWRFSARTWQALEPPDRADWTAAARLAHLKISGYNLFLFYQLTKDASIIQTVERQSKTSLL